MIRQADVNDSKQVVQLAQLLRPTCRLAALEEAVDILQRDKAAVYIALVKKKVVGFAFCQTRSDFVEGTTTSPVAYLEAIFVREDYRRQGIGRDLLMACEHWARERGCREFASDCELTNTDSLMFHLKSNFVEVNRLICFKKEI